MVYCLQEINGITAALAEELFHKGKELAVFIQECSPLWSCIHIPFIFYLQAVRDLTFHIWLVLFLLLLSFCLFLAAWTLIQGAFCEEPQQSCSHSWKQEIGEFMFCTMYVYVLLICILKGCGRGDQERLSQCVFSVTCKEAWSLSVSPDSLCSL